MKSRQVKPRDLKAPDYFVEAETMPTRHASRFTSEQIRAARRVVGWFAADDVEARQFERMLGVCDDVQVAGS